MRIRKRTPARAASPGPTPFRAASPPPPPPPLQQPKQESPQEEEKEKPILVGDREQEDHFPAASKNRAIDVPKTDPGTQVDSAVRCSRNDGKRWRCKGAAVPGYLFCDRHVSWSTRKRKPRAKKNRGSRVKDKEEESAEEEAVNKEDAATTDDMRGNCSGSDDDDGFYYYGGFQPGSRKRAKITGSAGLP